MGFVAFMLAIGFGIGLPPVLFGFPAAGDLAAIRAAILVNGVAAALILYHRRPQLLGGVVRATKRSPWALAGFTFVFLFTLTTLAGLLAWLPVGPWLLWLVVGALSFATLYLFVMAEKHPA